MKNKQKSLVNSLFNIKYRLIFLKQNKKKTYIYIYIYIPYTLWNSGAIFI